MFPNPCLKVSSLNETIMRVSYFMHIFEMMHFWGPGGLLLKLKSFFGFIQLFCLMQTQGPTRSSDLLEKGGILGSLNKSL